MSPRSPSKLRLSASGLLPRDSPDTSRTLFRSLCLFNEGSPASSIDPPRIPALLPERKLSRTRTPYAYRNEEGTGEGEMMRQGERKRDTPGERNKKKNRGRVYSRRVALSFLRPGTSERRTPRLREPVCGAVSTGRDGRATREAIPFPTERTFEWCARLFAVLVETARSSDFSGRVGIRPRRSIRLEHGTPANGGVW